MSDQQKKRGPLSKHGGNDFFHSATAYALLDTNSTGPIKIIETFPARLCQLNAKQLPLHQAEIRHTSKSYD